MLFDIPFLFINIFGIFIVEKVLSFKVLELRNLIGGKIQSAVKAAVIQDNSVGVV